MTIDSDCDKTIAQSDLDRILNDSPDNFVIRDALIRCYEVLSSHHKILCSVSGGADSDIMLDMLIRCGGKDKTTFVFYNTGIEYSATKDHLFELEQKYSITIHRENAVKPVPVSVKKYGQPFLSKYVANMIHRLQKHDFKWEDRPFEELIIEYPKCKTALEWWCDVTTSKTTQFAIKRFPFLKEYMMQNPPRFMVSDRCCFYAKEKVSERFVKDKGFDLICVGVRRAEGGARASSHKTCFSEGDGQDSFRPVWWLRDVDKEEYCAHYGVSHGRCYTEYGLRRTGCVGCPFGLNYEAELEVLRRFEPKLYAVATNIFGDSYEYTSGYRAFRWKMKKQKSLQKCVRGGGE